MLFLGADQKMLEASAAQHPQSEERAITLPDVLNHVYVEVRVLAGLVNLARLEPRAEDLADDIDRHLARRLPLVSYVVSDPAQVILPVRSHGALLHRLFDRLRHFGHTVDARQAPRHVVRQRGYLCHLWQ